MKPILCIDSQKIRSQELLLLKSTRFTRLLETVAAITKATVEVWVAEGDLFFYLRPLCLLTIVRLGIVYLPDEIFPGCIACSYSQTVENNINDLRIALKDFLVRWIGRLLNWVASILPVSSCLLPDVMSKASLLNEDLNLLF